MAIRVIAGTIAYKDGRRQRMATCHDGVIVLPPELEARFVKRGVAEYAEEVEQMAADEVTEDAATEAPDEVTEEEADTSEEEQGEQDGKAVPFDDGIDYNEMSVSELKAECDARGLAYKPKASKTALVAILEEDDKVPELEAMEVE